MVHLRGASGRLATHARVHHNLADSLRCMVGRLWHSLIWFRCVAFGGGGHRSHPCGSPRRSVVVGGRVGLGGAQISYPLPDPQPSVTISAAPFFPSIGQ